MGRELKRIRMSDILSFFLRAADLCRVETHMAAPWLFRQHKYLPEVAPQSQ